MPAAIAVPALIGAAGSIGSAVAQSRAAGKANDAQQAGARKAEGAQNQAYQTQQDIYRSMLGGASTTLGRLLTPGAGATFAAEGPAPQMFGAQSPGVASRPAVQPKQFGMQRVGPVGASTNPMGAPMSPAFAQAMGSQNVGPMGPAVGGPMGPAQSVPWQSPNVASVSTGPRMVQLRAPDGSMGQVPEHLADQFIARGAMRVQ